MGELEHETHTLEQFVASGRSGRRNALPSIDVPDLDPEGEKLAEHYSKMQVAGGSDKPSTSNAENEGVKETTTAAS